MRNQINNIYKAFNTVCLRTPLLSMHSFIQLEKESDQKSVLKKFFQTPLGREALFLASQPLYREFERYLKKDLTDDKKIEHLFFSLMKYYIRLSTRSTPFGLFAGYSTIFVGSSSKFKFKNIEFYKKNARLDMSYVCKLIDHICNDSILRKYMTFYPNSSISIYSDQIRYVEYYYVGNKRSHSLVSINLNEFIYKILKYSKEGITIDKAASLIIDEEITREIADHYINTLIESQILVSNLQPVVTGNDVLQHLNISLIELSNKIIIKQHLNRVNEYKDYISSIQKSIISINGNNSKSLFKEYDNIELLIKKIDPFLTHREIIQVDLNKTTEYSEINFKCIEAINKGLEIFTKFSPRIFRSLRTSQNNFQKFKTAFETRYETREIALCEALDSEKGIGYIQNIQEDADYSDILRTINIPAPQNNLLSEMTWDGKLHTFWFAKFIEAERTNSYNIIIKDEDLSAFQTRTQECSPTLSVMASIISEEDPNNPIILIKGVNGISASKLLGRFGTSSKEIEHLLQEISNKEDELSPNAIIAEIVHLPESVIGNIILRPRFRKYEIPYLANSSVNKENQIDISDLTISIRNNKVKLISKKLGKEIIPHLSNAHNFSYNSLPIYHFLADYAAQRWFTDIYINLGILSRVANFYPRITYKNIILKQASWRFKVVDVQAILNETGEKQILLFRSFCKKHNIPKYVSYVQKDNALAINTTDNFMIKMFLKEIRNLKSFTLEEFFVPKNHKESSNEILKYSNEIIVAFYRNEISKNDTSDLIDNYIEETEIKRSFTIGEKWLYFKLYTGIKSSENIIVKGIQPLTKKLVELGIIEKWFFIRFKDPDHHIRLRLYLTDRNKTGHAIALFKKYIDPFEIIGEIWKVQVDTYNRELERYGKNTISHAESIFYTDSVFCLKILSILKGNIGEKWRWKIAIKSIDEYLNSFKYNLEEKLNILTIGRDSLAKEFNCNKELKNWLNTTYRQYQKEIDLIITSSNYSVDKLDSLRGALSERINNLMEPIEAIRNIAKSHIQLNQWVLSYTHMHLNRLFKSKQRLHEFIIYDLLVNYYRAQIGRMKYSQKIPLTEK